MSSLKNSQVAFNILRLGNQSYGFDCIFTQTGVPEVSMTFQYLNIGESQKPSKEDIRIIEENFTNGLNKLYKTTGGDTKR